MPGIETNATTTYLYGGLDFIGLFRFLYEKLPFGSWESFAEFLKGFWNIYSVIAILLSLLFFVGFVYSKIRLGQLYEVLDQQILDQEALWAARHNGVKSSNFKWDSIQKKITENNPESWRVAILEADIMLDETLTNAGYVGQSIGEKLKTANPQSFTTVQDAWDAHKVRNDIAHVGSDFVLTQKAAKETLTRFERVFREFDVI